MGMALTAASARLLAWPRQLLQLQLQRAACRPAYRHCQATALLTAAARRTGTSANAHHACRSGVLPSVAQLRQNSTSAERQRGRVRPWDSTGISNGRRMFAAATHQQQQADADSAPALAEQQDDDQDSDELNEAEGVA